MTVSADTKAAQLTDRVAAEIRAVMGRQMVRQSQLARLLGENDTWMSMRLRGLVPINLNELERIADALGVDVVDLLPRSGEGRSPRSGEGRAVVVAGEPRRSTTVAKHTPPKRLRPTGHPKPFAPHDSTRRPVRLSPVPA